jgi:hypothetical protein
MSIIVVIKPNSDVNLGQDSSLVSGGSTRVNIKIKVIIIIVLKFYLRVNLEQGPSHGIGLSTQVNVRIKIIIIIVLKLDSMVDQDKV